MIVAQDELLGDLLITLVSVQHRDAARTLLTRLHVGRPEIVPVWVDKPYGGCVGGGRVPRLRLVVAEDRHRAAAVLWVR